MSHELDSDDELILSLRERGHSDKQIADKLATDGRVRYDAKSISTRIMRIRLAQAERVEFLIREGYREWEFEDVSYVPSLIIPFPQGERRLKKNEMFADIEPLNRTASLSKPLL